MTDNQYGFRLLPDLFVYLEGMRWSGNEPAPLHKGQTELEEGGAPLCGN